MNRYGLANQLRFKNSWRVINTMHSKNIKHVIARLQQYIEQEDYKGWDPYDALNGKIIRWLTLGIKPLRIAAIQLMRKNPLNKRPIFGIRKGINPKGMGLIVYGYLNMYERTGDSQYSEKAKEVLKWLIDNHSQFYSGYCWGYNFDWQSRAFFLPKYTPTVVNTSFIGRAFIKAYSLLDEKKYMDIARSSCDFILKDLNRLEVDGSLCFSYSPLDHYFVHNATALASSLLALIYAQTKESALLEIACKSLQYVANHQQENGAWYYGEDEIAKKTGIDNFHTGFVLESFKIYADATCDHRFDDVIKKGLSFWQKNFFLPDGAPKYFCNRVYPLDIHSACQAIITLIQLKEYGTDLELCDKIVKWMIDNMWDEKKGYFYYQKGRFITNKIPYLRWSQAWAFYALSVYLSHSEKNDS